MPTTLEWSDIGIRLGCTLLAGALIGLDRSEHGRAAGLRTAMLVSLAACLAMIQVNFLLSVAGKTPSSFVNIDPMRLPLGVLSGMGFIGAGAIVRRDNFVVGVTTAATMWFVTIIGLIFGGGQIALGMIGVAIGMVVLSGLSAVEDWMKQDHMGMLSMTLDATGPGEDEIRLLLEKSGYKISSTSFALNNDAHNRDLIFDLQWRARRYENQLPAVIHGLADRPGVIRVGWTPLAR